MDPLSIAAGAVALAAAASKASTWIYEMAKDSQIVDARVSQLSKEITILTALLRSVETTTRECQAQKMTLAHVDDDLWRQIDDTVLDCATMLEGLDRLISDIKGPSKSKNFFRKTSLQLRVKMHGDEISFFVDKIYKSNCALQTAIAVLNVSLLLRANGSQETVFKELHGLKALITEALRVSAPAGKITDANDVRMSRNLSSLAISAQNFHSSASSIASTTYGGDTAAGLSTWGGSEAGGLTDFKRERIEIWNRLASVEESEEIADGGIDDHSSTAVTISGQESNLPVKEEESDVELDLLNSLEELATHSFQRSDYVKAEQFLLNAIELSAEDASRTENVVTFTIRLSLCYCLQENWESAASVLSPLLKPQPTDNPAAFHILHAVSIHHLQNGRPNEAREACMTALQGKKRGSGKGSRDYAECLALLARIYEAQGDVVKAEAVWHTISKVPAANLSKHHRPSSEAIELSAKTFILEHETLLSSAFGSGGEGSQHSHRESAELDNKEERPPSKGIQLTVDRKRVYTESPGQSESVKPPQEEVLEIDIEPSKSVRRWNDEAATPAGAVDENPTQEMSKYSASHKIPRWPPVKTPKSVATGRIIVSIMVGKYVAAAWGLSSEVDTPSLPSPYARRMTSETYLEQACRPRVIDRWPGINSTVMSVDVPFHIQQCTSGYAWGFQIPPNAKRNKLSSPPAFNGPYDEKLQLHQLYLTYVYKHIRSVIEAHVSADVAQELPLDLAIQPDSCNQSDDFYARTMIVAETAARDAGLKPATVSRTFYLESSIASFLDASGHSTSSRDGSYLVCGFSHDCVDFCCFEVATAPPPLRLKAITEGTGGRIGWSMFSKRFCRLLKRAHGDEYWSDERLDAAMSAFHLFAAVYSRSGEQLTLTVDPTLNCKRNMYTVPREDMDLVFEPVMKDFIELAQEQIRMAPADCVSTVVIFGGPRILETRLRESISPSIAIARVEGQVEAIVQGGVLLAKSRVNGV